MTSDTRSDASALLFVTAPAHLTPPPVRLAAPLCQWRPARKLNARARVLCRGDSGKAQGGPSKDAEEPEWRPHTVRGDDADCAVGDIPVELAEGFAERDGGTQPRFDLDADETMMLWKLRCALNDDDFKRIFEHPRVGGL